MKKTRIKILFAPKRDLDHTVNVWMKNQGGEIEVLSTSISLDDTIAIISIVYRLPNVDK